MGMGTKNHLFTAGIICVILLSGFGVASGAAPDRFSHADLRSDFDSGNTFQGESVNPLTIPDLPDRLQTIQKAESVQASILVTLEGAITQYVTMPAVITSPGRYRIINDYTANASAPTGLIIRSSDVLVEGQDHIFSGNDLPDSVGVEIAGAESGLYENLCIRNLTLVNSSVGISCEQAKQVLIINTTHTSNGAGIVINNSELVSAAYFSIREGKNEETGGGILADNVSSLLVLSGTIENTGPETSRPGYGVLLTDSNGSSNIILGNRIAGQKISAITSYAGPKNQSSTLFVVNNTIDGSGQTGIDTRGSHPDSLTFIAWNTISRCYDGMYVATDNSSFFENTVSDSGEFGILVEAQNCRIINNTMLNNQASLGMYGETPLYFLHTMEGNYADGKPVVYVRDAANVTIGPEHDPAMVIVARSSNVTVHDIATSHAGSGNLLVGVRDLKVFNVTDTASFEGLVLYMVEGADIRNCFATQNRFGHAVYYSESLNLTNITTSDSRSSGISVYDSENALVHQCMVTNTTPPDPDSEGIGILSESNTDLRIINTSVSESATKGVILYNTTRSALSVVFIGDSGEDGLYADSSSDIVVNRSLIGGSGQYGLHLVRSANLTVNQNYILENQGPGIMMTSLSQSLIADNYLNNTQNLNLSGDNPGIRWNTTLTPGENIVEGPYLGGNYWADPEGTGFSQTHPDRGDGISAEPYLIAPGHTDFLPLVRHQTPLVPGFTADRTYGTPPLTVQFQDTTTGSPVRWNWTFGDGTQSAEQNPVHVYTGVGRYTVTLEVTSLQGEQGIIRKPGFVQVSTGRITGPNGMIWISSAPAGAKVYVDSVFIGETPLQSSGIPAGVHQVRVSAAGYQDWIGFVQINHGVYTYVPKVVLKKL
jgi:parallel beta-helix repeat protein